MNGKQQPLALLIIRRTVCKTLFITRMLLVNNLESGLTNGKNWPWLVLCLHCEVLR